VNAAVLALTGVIVITALSAALHELGHVAVAKALHGKTHGLVWRWYGVGCRLEVEREKLWLVALGGLTASGLLALLFLLFDGPFAHYGFTLNAVVVFSNLVPHPSLDGGYILRHFRGHDAQST